MSDEELVIKEAPLQEKAVNHDRMGDYMDMIATPQTEQATPQAIQKLEQSVVIPREAPQQTEASPEELEARSGLLEDYMDVVIPEQSSNVEVMRHQDSYDNVSQNVANEAYIQRLAEEQIVEESNTTPSDDVELRPKTLTANRMAQYLGFIDDEDPNKLVEDLEDFVEEEYVQRKPLIIESQDNFNPPKTHIQDREIRVNTGDYDKYEYESYIGGEFSEYLRQQYGSKKSALLDRMFVKQSSILGNLQGEVEEKYYDMADNINTNYDRNTKLVNFKNTVKFFTKFYHYLKFKEDDLMDEEEDLLDVIKDIYTVLNRTTTL